MEYEQLMEDNRKDLLQIIEKLREQVRDLKDENINRICEYRDMHKVLEKHVYIIHDLQKQVKDLTEDNEQKDRKIDGLIKELRIADNFLAKYQMINNKKKKLNDPTVPGKQLEQGEW